MNKDTISGYFSTIIDTERGTKQIRSKYGEIISRINVNNYSEKEEVVILVLQSSNFSRIHPQRF
jgi:hypothetical protein